MIKEEKVNLILFGDTYVGKTSLIKRYVNGQSKDCCPTAGFDLLHINKNIDDQEVYFNIWDTAGQERYKSMTNGLFREIHGGFVVFDITSKTTFDSVKDWIAQFRSMNCHKAHLILVGNKCDLDSEREISKHDAQKLAEDEKIAYVETSAINGQGVNEAFEVLENAAYRTFVADYTQRSIDIRHKEDKPSSSRC